MLRLFIFVQKEEKNRTHENGDDYTGSLFSFLVVGFLEGGAVGSRNQCRTMTSLGWVGWMSRGVGFRWPKMK